MCCGGKSESFSGFGSFAQMILKSRIWKINLFFYVITCRDYIIAYSHSDSGVAYLDVLNNRKIKYLCILRWLFVFRHDILKSEELFSYSLNF